MAEQEVGISVRNWPDARLTDLADMRRFVEDTGTAAGYPAERTFDLVLAVDEAATNVLLHGYNGKGGPVEIEVEAAEHAFVVRIRDRAPRFDPTMIETPDELPPLLDRPPGGMGIFLIRKSMDEFSYRRTPEGCNELTLALRM